MERFRWPGPIRTLRGHLPAEMRILRGVGGALGGAILSISILGVLLGGNWRLGFGDDRLFVGIFLVLVPAGLGLASPVWYWFGRPVWAWFDRPGLHLLGPLQESRFLPGLAGSVVGVTHLFPVSATSHLLVQTLAPFGLAIALGAPLWYWLVRPIGAQSFGRRLPGFRRESQPTTFAIRSLLVLGLVFVLCLALTTVIAIPIVGLGESVSADGRAVSIVETQLVAEVTESESGEARGSHSWQLLLVRISVENQGKTPQHLPGTSVGDITVIAPPCSAQNFGEPSHNCNQVYVDGNFSPNGTTYANYDTRQARADGTVPPGDRIDGWLVFRLESRPPRDPGFAPMVIVDDVGRWTLDDRNWSAATAETIRRRT